MCELACPRVRWGRGHAKIRSECPPKSKAAPVAKPQTGLLKATIVAFGYTGYMLIERLTTQVQVQILPEPKVQVHSDRLLMNSNSDPDQI